MDARIPLALLKTGIKLEAMLPNGTNDELKNHGVDLSQLSGMATDEMVEALAELEVDIEGPQRRARTGLLRVSRRWTRDKHASK